MSVCVCPLLYVEGGSSLFSFVLWMSVPLTLAFASSLSFLFFLHASTSLPVPTLLSPQDSPVDMGVALGPALLLTSLLGAWAGLGPGQGEQTVTVAVVFGSSGSPQAQARTRLTPQSFLDLPLDIQPLTVGVNNTNPSSLLIQICGLLGAARVHGIVFEDNVGTEAVAQILDFVSSQTHVPILSISGGSAVVLTPKVPVQSHVFPSLELGARLGLGVWAESGPGRCLGPGKVGLGGPSKDVGIERDMGEGGEGCGNDDSMFWKINFLSCFHICDWMRGRQVENAPPVLRQPWLAFCLFF